MRAEQIKKFLRRMGVQPAGVTREWVQCRCPFAPWLHKSGRDRNPSAGVRIREDKPSHFYCFGCKTAIPFHEVPSMLGRYREEPMPDLVREIVLEESRTVPAWVEEPEIAPEPEPLNESAYGDLYGRAWDVPMAREYLARRNVTEDAADRLGLGWDDAELRVTFPVRDHAGALWGYTGRTVLPERDYPSRRYPKIRDYLGLPKKSLLLGEHLCAQGKPMFVVEGLFGYACLHSRGIHELVNIVALMGSVMTRDKADRLIEWGEPVYLCTDPDPAGEQCLFGRWDAEAQEYTGGGAVDMLKGEVPVYVPDWPEGKTDPDELTFADVREMLRRTPEWSLDRKSNEW